MYSNNIRIHGGFYLFFLSSLAVKAHAFKYGEVRCMGFEPRPLHIVISRSTIIGILPVKRVREQMLTENKYDGECLSNDIG